MADIITLNKVRKARAKSDDRTNAMVNRVAHGRTKAERSAAEAEQMRIASLLDGARRED